MISQIAIPKSGRGGRRKPPWVFTEQGVAMLSSVLRSDRAADVNLEIMRTFVRLRQMLASNEELARKVAQHDQEIGILFEHIQGLLEPPEQSKKRRIGFNATDDGDLEERDCCSPFKRRSRLQARSLGAAKRPVLSLLRPMD